MTFAQNFGFGSGVLFATPSDSATPTPIRLGIMQDVSVDFAFSTKPLFGSYQFPVAIGRGTAKVSGKAKFAQIDGGILNKIMFNNTPASGQIKIVDAEAGTIPATPFQITVTNAATFENDLGVAYATTGQPLTRGATATGAGVYAVNESTGVYTFNTADAAAAVVISYEYTTTGAGSRTIITNQLLGTAIPFQVDFYQASPNVAGQQWGLRLYSCMSGKLSFATKLEDFTIPEFEFEAYANAANQLGVMNLPS